MASWQKRRLVWRLCMIAILAGSVGCGDSGPGQASDAAPGAPDAQSADASAYADAGAGIDASFAHDAGAHVDAAHRPDAAGRIDASFTDAESARDAYAPIDAMRPLDAATHDASSDAGTDAAWPDAGLPVCRTDEWLERPSLTCQVCPAPETTCESLALLGETHASWDPDTKRFTLPVREGTAQIVSGTMVIYMFDGMDYGPSELSVTLHVLPEHVLVADYARLLPPDTTRVDHARLTLVDACGASYSFDVLFTTGALEGGGFTLSTATCPIPPGA